MLNSDILNEGNNRNPLNLVCPHFKREIERGGRTFGVRARLKIECAHSFKKALIDFYASSSFSLLNFYCLITS